MSDRPILFSAPMVRAILREIAEPGTGKGQTRRILKLRGHSKISEFGRSNTAGYDWHFRDAEARWHDLRQTEILQKLLCQIGDRLWVREAFCVGYDYDESDKPVGDLHAFYAASECPRWYDTEADQWRESPKWTPSIHMPRWASRLTLTVTDVHVERLQDISFYDCRAEGAERLDLPDNVPLPSGILTNNTYKVGFSHLWDAINGPGAWDQNPWVVAIRFAPELRNIDARRSAFPSIQPTGGA